MKQMLIILAVIVAMAVVAFKLLDDRVDDHIDIGGEEVSTSLLPASGVGASAAGTAAAALSLQEAIRSTTGEYAGPQADAVTSAYPTIVWIDGGLPSDDTHVVSMLTTEDGSSFVAAILAGGTQCLFVRATDGEPQHLTSAQPCAAAQAPVQGPWLDGPPA